MTKLRAFLSESLKNKCTKGKELKHSNKIAPSPTSLQVRFITGKIKTLIVEALRNYTHKSFITFFTVGSIFLTCMIIAFGNLIWTTSTSSKPEVEVILVYNLVFVCAVCIFSVTLFLLFLFREVLQHAIDRTSWVYNCVRVLFLVVDVITAIKWYSAAIQARPNGMINYILMAAYIKAGSLALLGFLYLTWCVYEQHKNKTFQSLLKLKFGVLSFLSLNIISIIAFRYQGISWQTTAVACSLFYLGFALCVMVLPISSDKESELVKQIKITGLLIVFYVIIISLFLVIHYDMDCDNHCGQRVNPIKHHLDTLDTPKILDGDFDELKNEINRKNNQTRRNDNAKKDGTCSSFTKTPITITTMSGVR